MSRSDVLVDADWVEQHLGDAGVVIVEVDEDPQVEPSERTQN